MVDYQPDYLPKKSQQRPDHLMVLKIILPDFPGVWGVLRVIFINYQKVEYIPSEIPSWADTKESWARTLWIDDDSAVMFDFTRFQVFKVKTLVVGIGICVVCSTGCLSLCAVSFCLRLSLSFHLFNRAAILFHTKTNWLKRSSEWAEYHI